MPLISICIPAYNRTTYLKRLFESIADQLFKDFEVIVSDDSPSDSVKDLCAAYSNKFTLRYFKNQPSLGTPANWNNAIEKAIGSNYVVIQTADELDTESDYDVQIIVGSDPPDEDSEELLKIHYFFTTNWCCIRSSRELLPR